MRILSGAGSGSRRAQIQMGEMVMVLIVVFLIGIAGLVWAVRSSASAANAGVSRADQAALVTAASTVANLPELRYSLDSRVDATVIDYERAKAFAQDVGTDGAALYRDRFAGYSATLQCVTPCADTTTDPDTGTTVTHHVFPQLTLFDYTDATAARRNANPLDIPVLLYDPVTKESSYGILTLTQVLP